jgi:thiaminase
MHDLVAVAQREIVKTPNRFVDALEAGDVPNDRLRALAGELYWLVCSDRKSFALLASRFPDYPLFLTMAAGEDEALRLLLDFADAVGMEDPQAYEPQPLAQAYPAFLAQTAMFGPRSAIPLALLVNVEESGGYYTRVADALVAQYDLPEKAVTHFRFFADTPEELLAQAADIVTDGLSTGDSRREVLRAARMVNAYEATFWDTMARAGEP